MKTSIVILASMACLTACALGPDAAEPSWTDMRLRAVPPGGAPVYVEQSVLSRGERLSMAGGALMALEARDEVRRAGEVLRQADVDTAEFV
ncbi:MAG: hypothetical protein ACOC20_01555, partial [Oceanicaulis sp.]